MPPPASTCGPSSYDRPLKDIFAVQDEVEQKIVRSLKFKLTFLEQGYLVRIPTDNLEAYDFFLARARVLLAFHERGQCARRGRCVRKL